MKKHIQRRNNKELLSYPIKDIVDGWLFRIEEISQGYYRVEGIDAWGHIVSREGIDPDQLLNELKADIREKFMDDKLL
jgi:hypothetical protein